LGWIKIGRKSWGTQPFQEIEVEKGRAGEPSPSRKLKWRKEELGNPALPGN